MLDRTGDAERDVELGADGPAGLADLVQRRDPARVDDGAGGADGAAELGVSASYAYKVIRRLNDELKAKGFVTIAGRINRQYFNERVYGPGTEGWNNVCS